MPGIWNRASEGMLRRGRVAGFALLLVWSYAWSASAVAQRSIESGCEVDYPPFCFVDADGNAAGFSVDLMREALRAMGRDVTFRTGLWEDLKQNLERGDLRALPLVGRTSEREGVFDFTFPYLTMHGAIVVREGSTDIRGLSDLAGRRVAVMKGDNAEEFLRREERGIDLRTTSTFAEAFRALADGACDAVVIQRLVALRLLRETGITGLRILAQPVEGFSQDFCFAVREGDRETLSLLNEGLALVMADGTYRRLHAKWFAAMELPSGRRIVVGGDHDYPPYEYLDSRGRPAGYNVELTRAIAQEVGLDIEIRLDRWSNIRRGLELGEIDIVQGMFYSPERDRFLDFTPPHAVNHCISVVRAGEGPAPGTLDKLRGLRIVVQEGDIMDDLLRVHGITQQTVVVRSQGEALKQLAGGQHDCALVARMTALYWIKEEGWTNLVLGTGTFLAPEYCYAVPDDHDALLAQFSEGLRLLDENGEYRRIQAKWLGVYETEDRWFRSALRYAAWVAGPLLLFLAVSLAWSWTLRRQVALRTGELREEMAERRRATEQVGKLLEESDRVRKALLSILEDVKRTEQELRDSEERYRLLVENASEAIYVVQDGTFMFANATCARLLGLEKGASLVGRRLDEFLLEDQRDFVQRHHRELLDGHGSDRPFEVRARRPSGGEFWVSVNAVRISWGGKAASLNLATDTTGRRQMEDELRRQSDFLQRMIDAMPYPVFYKDRESRYLGCNRAFESFFGDQRENIVGKTVFEIAPRDVAERYHKADAELLENPGEQIYEGVIISKDGVRHDVIFHKATFTDAEGRVAGIIGAVVDITGRKQAEEEVRALNVELELRVKDRTAELEAANRELEAFSYSVSHDLRGPLRTIAGFSQTLIEDYGDKLGAEGRQDLDRVYTAARKMSVLIDDLLILSRLSRREFRKEKTDLSRLATHVIGELQAQDAQRRVEVHVQEGLTAECDPELIEVVLRNLLGNAWKFTSKVDHAVIRFGVVEKDDVRSYFVSDNGAGFDMRYADKLFGPFQRLHTDDEFPGTGIGLATVQRIIHRHGGWVWAEGEPGRGATFYFVV